MRASLLVDLIDKVQPYPPAIVLLRQLVDAGYTAAAPMPLTTSSTLVLTDEGAAEPGAPLALAGRPLQSGPAMSASWPISRRCEARAESEIPGDRRLEQSTPASSDTLGPMKLPAEMNALVADALGDGPVDALGKLRVTRLAMPRPGPGQVLVRIHAAPCNPADLLYLEGRYGIDRPLPATPGFEGAGVVVASGGGLIGRWLRGKRVACGGHSCGGTWAEYCVTDAKQCLPLRSDLTFEQGATALANPMTALALTALIRKGGHRAYVQTAAAGQLGRMILAVAAERGLVGIHVVRRASQAAALRALGAEHVLVSTDGGFEDALRNRCRELGATIALDAVAGPTTGQLVDALPARGEIVVYGALSGEPCGGADPMAFAFGDKHVRGFEIAAHLRALGLFASFRLGTAAQRRVAAGRAMTHVRGRLSLADAPAGLAEYARSMFGGEGAAHAVSAVRAPSAVADLRAGVPS